MIQKWAWHMKIDHEEINMDTFIIQSLLNLQTLETLKALSQPYSTALYM